MENTVIGVYDSDTQADNALNELLASGFSRNDVQLSTNAAGAAESEAGGTGIGHFFRTLFGMEEPHEHHGLYAEAVRRGSCVLTVNAADDEQRERAVEIMNRYEPVNIEERAAHWRSRGWTGYDESAPPLSESEIAQERSRYVSGRDISGTDNTATQTGFVQTPTGAQTPAAGNVSAQAGATFPVVEEELKVGKREVQRGGVRIYQRVRETPVEESVQLREEHVKVERHPVNQPATEADMAAFKEGAVELREMAEEPVVSKTARVVEEVVVGKEIEQTTADIKDTLRKTEIEVEPLNATARTDIADTVAAGEDADFRDHWRNVYGQSSGARYEDYDAAYRYGATLGGSDRFRNYRWSDVEGDVRSDWEAHHPESAWDKVKDAVRYGAERASGSRH